MIHLFIGVDPSVDEFLHSHEYPCLEILGRYFSLLQSHCSS